jgi:hypothetical protein
LHSIAPSSQNLAADRGVPGLNRQLDLAPHHRGALKPSWMLTELSCIIVAATGINGSFK